MTCWWTDYTDQPHQHFNLTVHDEIKSFEYILVDQKLMCGLKIRGKGNIIFGVRFPAW